MADQPDLGLRGRGLCSWEKQKEVKPYDAARDAGTWPHCGR